MNPEYGIITLEGLRKLFEMKEEGKPLPEGWEEQLHNYLELKIRAIQKQKKTLEKEKRQLSQIIGYGKLLGIVWDPRLRKTAKALS